MSRVDFDPEEQEFRRDIEAALSGRAGPGICPKPDLLMAARSGVSFEGAEDVLRHVALCPICEQLSRDLAEHEFRPLPMPKTAEFVQNGKAALAPFDPGPGL